MPPSALLDAVPEASDMQIARQFMAMFPEPPDVFRGGLGLSDRGASRQIAVRPRRDQETYEIQCWRCRRTLEVPVVPPFHCPRCGGPLALVWKEQPAK
jgi:hypothetical protein